MAFKERTDSSNTMLLSIKQFKVDGKAKAGICRDSKQPRDGYIKVSVYNPNDQAEQEKWLKVYDEVEAYIDEVRWYDREIKGTGKRMSGIDLHLTDDDGLQAVLSLPYGKAVFQKFCYVAENIDFSKPVAFRAWLGFDETKKKEETVFNLKQGEASLKHVYTKDNPGELPPAVKSKVTGKWSFDNHNEWLVNRMIEVVAPKAEAAAAKRGPVKTQQPAEQMVNKFNQAHALAESIVNGTEPDWGDDPWSSNDEEPTPNLTPAERGKQLFEQGKVTMNLKTRNYAVADTDFAFDEQPVVWRDDKKINQCTCNPGRPDNAAAKCQHLIAVNWFYAAQQKEKATA